MSLPEDLLDLGARLAELDPRRPKQVNLRRAISSAYYALFHLLTTSASKLYAVAPETASRINRTVNHADVRRASAMAVADKLPRAIHPRKKFSAPDDLKRVAKAFEVLYDARQAADYDLFRTFRRNEALDHVALARDAFRAWSQVQKTDEARLYLACFLLWKRWDDEPR